MSHPAWLPSTRSLIVGAVSLALGLFTIVLLRSDWLPAKWIIGGVLLLFALKHLGLLALLSAPLYPALSALRRGGREPPTKSKG